jgi:small subunit ribosomal protein S20
MPYHKSSKKRVITSKKQNLRNRISRTRMSTAIKNVNEAKTKESAETALSAAYSVIDKAQKNNVIHKNNAANKKSQLKKIVQKVVG